MRRLIKRMLPLAAAILCMTSLALAASAAEVGVFSGNIAGFRKEVHESDPQVRYSARLLRNTRVDKAYWLYLATNDETLQTPNVGVVDFKFRLIDNEGRPATEARWTEDDSLPYDQWKAMTFTNGKWRMRYDVHGIPADTVELSFGGKIKQGSRTYTKLYVLGWEPTIHSKKRDLVRTHDFSFIVYDLDLGRVKADNRLLSNAQEAKGAGGTSALGPEVDQGDEEEEEKVDEPERMPAKPNPAPAAKAPSPRTVPIVFDGFESWSRIEWDTGKVEKKKIGGVYNLPIPKGAQKFDLYILDSEDAEGGYHVRYKGRPGAIPIDVKDVTVKRTAR